MMMYSGEANDGIPIGQIVTYNNVYFYVDSKNGVDTHKYGQGWYANKPWKTLNYAYYTVRQMVDTNSCFKTFHLAPGEYIWGSSCQDNIDDGSTLIDGKNDSNEQVIVKAGKDTSGSDAIKINRGFMQFRNVTFQSEKDKTYGLVVVDKGANCQFTDVIFEHPLNNHNSIYLRCTGSSQVKLFGTITMKANKIPKNTDYAVLFNSYEMGFLSLSGITNLVFDGFTSAIANRVIFIGAQTHSFLFATKKIPYSGSYGNMTGVTMAYYGHININGKEITSTSSLSNDILNSPVSTVSLDIEDEYIDTDYEENKRMFAIIDEEYKRVGIL